MKSSKFQTLVISFFLFSSSLFSQTFIPYPGNPIIPLTIPNPGVWNDPSVLKVGSEYWMYATSPNGTPGIFDGDVLPYLLKSTNGINWTLSNTTPLLQKNLDTTAWDSKGVETPSVVYFNSMYHMYYTAVPLNHPPGQFAIGHATSLDGETWIKDSIILTPSNIPTDWMSYSVAEPGAIVYQSKIYLYFTGIGARLDTIYPSGKSVIGLAISTDGDTFGPPQAILSQGTIYPPALGFYGYSTPNALEVSGALHLYYDVAQELPSWTQVAIHHAYSSDGITGYIEDTTPIFHKNDFTWSSREIRCPTVLLDSSKIKMWFGGDDIFNSSTFGIGYAYTTTLFSSIKNIETKNEFSVFPNPNNGSFTITSEFNFSQVIVCDLLGNIIFKGEKETKKEFSVITNNLSTGIYFIKTVTDKGEVFTKKIIIEK